MNASNAHTVCCKFECVHIKVNLAISYDLVHVWIDGGFGRNTVDHRNFDKSYLHLEFQHNHSVIVISPISPPTQTYT